VVLLGGDALKRGAGPAQRQVGKIEQPSAAQPAVKAKPQAARAKTTPVKALPAVAPAKAKPKDVIPFDDEEFQDF